jgi:hypothetical protein
MTPAHVDRPRIAIRGNARRVCADCRTRPATLGDYCGPCLDALGVRLRVELAIDGEEPVDAEIVTRD